MRMRVGTLVIFLLGAAACGGTNTMEMCRDGRCAACMQGECCRSNDDCSKQFEMCYAPGESIGCGACMVPQHPCQADAECTAQGPTSICDVPTCACQGEKDCIPGCTNDTSCPEGQTCGSNHRCQNRACTSPSDCPANFGCPNTTCVRLSCTTDAGCSGGVCVEGQCYSSFGFCSAPPA